MKNQDYRAKIFKDFEGHDRFDFPDCLKRVTAGMGGESFLIFTDEYSVLYDTGMAYCAEGLIENIEEELNKKNRDVIDYILISHTHYDHVGALSYVLKRWPDAVVLGSQKAKKVFASEGARNLMKRLGEKARDTYNGSRKEILSEGLRIDKILKDDDVFDLGNLSVHVLETKGHTDCSLTYVLEPQGIMFCSESTGVLRGKEYMHTAILKSYKDSIESVRKCINYSPKQLMAPHYGFIPKDYTKRYFELYILAAEAEKDMILGCAKKGMTLREIEEEHESLNWTTEREMAQPKPAYIENRKHTINCILKEFEEEL